MVEIMVPPDATIGHFIHKHKNASRQDTDWYWNKCLVIGIAIFDCREPYMCFTSSYIVRDNIQRLECGGRALDVQILAITHTGVH